MSSRKVLANFNVIIVKIVVLSRSLQYGGAERQLVALARGLHQRGHSVTVAAFYADGPLKAELDQAGVPVHLFHKKGRWDVVGFLVRLIGFLRVESPDILHGYLVVPNLLTVFLKPFLPKTKVVWGVRASDMDLSQFDWLARLTFKLSCRLSRFADCIIVNSHCGKTYHQQQGYPVERMVVISNGIDTERFKPSQEDRKRLRAEWKVEENEKLIGLMGRLDPMKDHPNFLKAAAILMRERNDVRFVCVGDGAKEYREALHQMSVELGLASSLTWAGARTDASAVYNSLDIATCSSITEGFPNVVGEAMSCGIPCVVTDVGDSAVIVGDRGIVVPPRDPRSLADGWNRCLAKAYVVPQKEIRNRIIREYSLQSLVEHTEQALERLRCSSSNSI